MSMTGFARRAAFLGTALLLVTPASLARANDSASARPVVVELFTSQGCSSCPPANANLAAVSDQPGVIALSFGVTYWDYLGWKDSFAKPEFTARQMQYVQSLHRATAYTPQMVVGGRMDLVGDQLDELKTAIATAGDEAAKTQAAPSVTVADGRVTIGAGAPQDSPADVLLVRYDPNVVQVAIARGENGGRTLPHKNVVHELARLGGWTGAAESFDLPPSADGLKTAILVQSAYTGPILAAASD
ncbi:MAG TPA: DUF1223 domain-containing protein [Candidatus Cybelea sp.]|nr:DUF1223 domain-containing protein [Candidatus Cybelea sp.]